MENSVLRCPPPTAREVFEETDGRHARHKRSHAAILSACRKFMRGGSFRPTVAAVASWACVTPRTVFLHFGPNEAMLAAALDDAETQRAILALVLRDSLPPQTEGDRQRLLQAVVLGRV